ncbi:MAG: hypothetical protein DID89_2727546944 [Candidatus Nitrotoga sp. CP45]|nr:MAG: hypothetical protein DID89_2727546944 [Candidatus Nitrotoga sp. CP45]
MVVRHNCRLTGYPNQQVINQPSTGRSNWF